MWLSPVSRGHKGLLSLGSTSLSSGAEGLGREQGKTFFQRVRDSVCATQLPRRCSGGAGPGASLSVGGGSSQGPSGLGCQSSGFGTKTVSSFLSQT